MQTVEKYMDTVTETDLFQLMRSETGPCLSLYMTTERRGSEIQQNPTRFKNLLSLAVEKIKAHGLDDKAVDALLAAVEPTAQDESREFWRYQHDGLALFVAPDRYEQYQLPQRFAPQVVVNDVFYLVPLLPLVTDRERFYVLTLDQGGVRLLQGSRYQLGEVDLEDVPESLAAALQYDDFERHVQFHTGTAGNTQPGDRSALYHGHGTAADEATTKENILRFFRALDNGVTDLLKSWQTPLVLAGLDHLRGLYREANHYKYLVEEDIEAAPRSLDDRSLHQGAWSIVEPLFTEADRQAMAAKYARLAGSGDERAIGRLEQIVPAAHHQRVDTLFIADGQQQWGDYDPETYAVTLADDPRPQHRELINDATIHTLRNGGAVYVIDPDKLPVSGPAAAILRY